MKLSKWHGLGNDYLLLERADLRAPLTEESVRRICDYHFGVGSDGILEVVSVHDDRAEIVIWNPDGSTAELSGNGTRIAARWLARRSASSEGVVRAGGRVGGGGAGVGRGVARRARRRDRPRPGGRGPARDDRRPRRARRGHAGL